MASALALMTNGATRMDIGGGRGVVGLGVMALDHGVGMASSYGIGQLYGRYREKWYGKHAATGAAVLGVGVASILQFVGGGVGSRIAAGAFNGLGGSGLNAIALQMGIKHGMKAVKRSVIALPPGVDPKTANLPAGSETIVGALPPAAAGRGLSFDQIEQLASMH